MPWFESYAAQLRSDAQVQRGGQPLRVPVDPRIRVWYNSDLKSKNFIVPGLIAVTMMIIASMLSSLTIAREWENGTMEQLLSTPVRPGELVLGKLLAYFALGLADMVISIVVGVFVFQVPFRGNVWFLLLTSCLFLFGALSWGIFLSASARSQLMAFQMGMLSSFLPGYLLSGFIYSIYNMPKIIQLVSYLVPARYFVTILNGVFLKGVGFRILWLEVLMLAAYAGLVFCGRIAQDAFEGGLIVRERLLVHHPQGIPSGFPRAAHAQHALPPAAHSTVRLRLRGEPGRRSRHAGLDGRRSLLPEPRTARCISRLRTLRCGREPGQRSRSPAAARFEHADLVVRVLPGFERDLARGRNTSVQVLINGTNSNTASIVSSYASSIITNFRLAK